MTLAPRLAAATAVRFGMRLALFAEMSEAELGEESRRLAADPLLKRLLAAGVVMGSPLPAARFAARRFAGYGLRLSGSGLPELVDGNCDLVRLMQGIGQERFEEWFLGAAASSDPERAVACGISVEQARALREFMDRAFIQGEFAGQAAPAPGKVFSTVAGIGLEGDKPALVFFHREVWQARYTIDEERLAQHLRLLPRQEASKVNDLLSRLRLVERRKTTLYRLLEEVIRIQADYLRTGEPARRQPLTQRAMAAALGVHPSVVNRLISNKSVQLPWGIEAPLAVFFPSAKDINRERLYELARANPGWRDEDLRRELEEMHGARCSRRSMAQYREELGLGGRGRR